MAFGVGFTCRYVHSNYHFLKGMDFLVTFRVLTACMNFVYSSSTLNPWF